MYYYTYAYLREDRTPYYIGKGKDNRAYRRKRNDIKPPKDKSRIIFLKQNLLEQEAFKHEKYMIAVFGRIDLGTGILHNKTNGGDGSSGRIVNEGTKRKLSEAQTGKTHSEETRRKMSEMRKGEKHYMYRINSENHPNYGKSASEETRRKMSKSKIKYQYKIYSIYDDNTYETNNICEFCQQYSLDNSHLYKTLTGKQNHHKGFKIIKKEGISALP